jgi:hypothetical protein
MSGVLAGVVQAFFEARPQFIDVGDEWLGVRRLAEPVVDEAAALHHRAWGGGQDKGKNFIPHPLMAAYNFPHGLG